MPIETTLIPFTIDPTFCKIDYVCKSVVPEPANASAVVPTCSDITFDNVYDNSGTDGVITFTADANDYIAGTFTPGTFKIEIEGTARKNGVLTESAFILMTLVDSCNPPVEITNPLPLVDQQYTLTD